jgi:hypothetical protein
LITRVAPALVSPATGVAVGGVGSGARTIVRPFHVFAVPKPVAARPMFATGSVPTERKALVPTLGALPAKVTDVIEVAPSNALTPIEVTLFGMVIEVRAVLNMNAALPMVVTLFGMVIEVRAWASLNAPASIDVTLFGMVIEVNEVVFLNALGPIEVRTLPASKVTEASAVALKNA